MKNGKKVLAALALAAALVVPSFALGRSSVETQSDWSWRALRAAERTALEAGPGYTCWAEVNVEMPEGYEVICFGG